jgi:hypothetical protein
MNNRYAQRNASTVAHSTNREDKGANVSTPRERIVMAGLPIDSFSLTDVDELAPVDTQNIPFFGFVTGTLISLGLWCMVAWTLWALID